MKLTRQVYEEKEEEEVIHPVLDVDDVILAEHENFDILDQKVKTKDKFLHTETKVIVFETGCYELKDIENVILQDKSHGEHKTLLTVDNVRMRIGIKSLWTLDMTGANSIGWLLGFEKKEYHPTGHYIWSTLPVQLFNVHNIRIKTNLTRCNIQDENIHDSTLYEFPLSVQPTEKIIERPIQPEYYKVVNNKLYNLRVNIVDQSDNLISFMGEKITILLHFRPSLY